MNKSPFILLEAAIPKEACDDIITSLDHYEPNHIDDQVVLTVKTNKLEELRLKSLIDDLLDYAEPFYDFETQRISDYLFEWYPEGYNAGKITSDGFVFSDDKWVKGRQVDFTILVFLSSSVTDEISDRDSEHIGGGLQFPTHGFTLHPKSGDVLMFPADNHFLNAVGDVTLGNMNLIRIKITAAQDYKYDRKRFPGNFRTWFT